MAPRKKKSATSESQSQEGESRCHWLLEDEKEFIAYIKENHAKGGDGLNFDRTSCSIHYFWWGEDSVQLCTAYSIIDRVAHYSGISWSAECGTDITFESKGVWANIIKNIPTANPYRNKGWPLYEYLVEFMPSKAAGQTAFHPLLQLSNLSMASSSSSSAAPQQPSFYDINMQEQEHVLNNLENASGGSNIAMLPPPPPAPFDAAWQPTFAPSTPGTSTGMFSLLKPTSMGLGKCKAKGDNSARSLTHPSGSTKEPSPEILQMGLDIHDLNATFGIAANTLQERTSYSNTHSVDPIPLR
ncbi:hypothetical protein BDR07DRAFT_1376596 [Suillus spraguei]|nr:hypothetical protein BDR07DRAFT_1376596 [Suillus spraguei]